MRHSSKLLPVLFVGGACLWLALRPGAVHAAAPGDAAQLLQQADGIKTTNHEKFIDLLDRVNAESAQLTPAQQLHLRYLNAWKTGYFGNNALAISQLDSIISDSRDATLRFRAEATTVNILQMASRNEEAYARLSQLIDLLPQVTDPEARLQGLGVATQLYKQSGQYDLALTYADKEVSENRTGKGACPGGYERVEILYKSGKLQSIDDEFNNAIDTCVKFDEPIWANLIRVDLAQYEIAQARPADAIKTLLGNYDEVQQTHFPRLQSAVDSTLAQAYWKSGDSQSAQRYAQRAVTGILDNQYTESVIGAYSILYQAAEKQGDYEAALTYHEKYAAADKGFLNDLSTRALAYQMVKQQVQEKKQQIDALNKKNQVLQLRQAVNRKDAEARDLYLVMLLIVLSSIALYAYRTKRSQLKFMKLARRDGLTGIFNRQHFIEASEQTLAYGAKSIRDACVVVIDLDHFKDVNDAHGHAAGDMVLKRAVAACQKHLRSMDVFGRLGGEEFGILMPDCVPERAFDVAELMRKEIAGLSDWADDKIGFPVYASFGISAARWSGYDLPQLLAQADSALYQAKREGRNRVVVYKPDRTSALPDRRQH